MPMHGPSNAPDGPGRVLDHAVDARQRARRIYVKSKRDDAQTCEAERDALTRSDARLDADAPERAAGAVRFTGVREPRAPPRVRRAERHGSGLRWSLRRRRLAMLPLVPNMLS